MPFLLGSVAGFADKARTAEILGAGNGSTTVFSFTFAKKPAYLNPVSLYYRVSGTNYTATSDAAGVLTGTHISSGQVDEDGIDVTFSTAPQSGFNITVDYRSKGLLTKLREFVALENYSETLDTGDGSTLSFSGTLAHTDVGKGQARLKFTIAGITHYVWDNGLGEWIHPQIDSSVLDYVTGEWEIVFVAAPSNSTNIDLFYSCGDEGQDWCVIVNRNTKNTAGSDAFAGLFLKEVVFKNSGTTYTENIFVGLRECQSVANSYYSLDLNCYNAFTGTEHWNWNKDGANGHGLTGYDATRNSYNTHPRISFNDDTITYRFYANKNRIIVQAQVTGSRWVSGYVGFGLRLSSPSDYPDPIIALGSHYGTGNYTDTGTTHSFIIDVVNAGRHLLYINPLGLYKGSNTPSGEGTRLLPKLDESLESTAYTRTTNNKVMRWPVYGYSLEYDWLLWELDGCYYCPDDAINSDSIIEEGSDEYRVFQNVHRNSYSDFMCVEEA